MLKILRQGPKQACLVQAGQQAAYPQSWGDTIDKGLSLNRETPGTVTCAESGQPQRRAMRELRIQVVAAVERVVFVNVSLALAYIRMLVSLLGGLQPSCIIKGLWCQNE